MAQKTKINLNSKHSCGQIYLLRQEKKTHRWSSLYEMEPIYTNFNFFGSWNHRQWPLSLSSPEPNNSLSSLLQKKKNWKIREINFDTKIDHL